MGHDKCSKERRQVSTPDSGKRKGGRGEERKLEKESNDAGDVDPTTSTATWIVGHGECGPCRRGNDHGADCEEPTPNAYPPAPRPGPQSTERRDF